MGFPSHVKWPEATRLLQGTDRNRCGPAVSDLPAQKMLQAADHSFGLGTSFASQLTTITIYYSIIIFVSADVDLKDVMSGTCTYHSMYSVNAQTHTKAVPGTVPGKIKPPWCLRNDEGHCSLSEHTRYPSTQLRMCFPLWLRLKQPWTWHWLDLDSSTSLLQLVSWFHNMIRRVRP